MPRLTSRVWSRLRAPFAPGAEDPCWGRFQPEIDKIRQQASYYMQVRQALLRESQLARMHYYQLPTEERKEALDEVFRALREVDMDIHAVTSDYAGVLERYEACRRGEARRRVPFIRVMPFGGSIQVPFGT